jgi:hypothetical protein
MLVKRGVNEDSGPDRRMDRGRLGPHRRARNVVVPVWIEVVLGHLVLIAGLGQHAVQQPRRCALADDVEHRRNPDVDLAAPVVRGVMDRVDGDLGLVGGSVTMAPRRSA